MTDLLTQFRITARAGTATTRFRCTCIEPRDDGYTLEFTPPSSMLLPGSLLTSQNGKHRQSVSTLTEEFIYGDVPKFFLLRMDVRSEIYRHELARRARDGSYQVSDNDSSGSEEDWHQLVPARFRMSRNQSFEDTMPQFDDLDQSLSEEDEPPSFLPSSNSFGTWIAHQFDILRPLPTIVLGDPESSSNDFVQSKSRSSTSKNPLRKKALSGTNGTLPAPASFEDVLTATSSSTASSLSTSGAWIPKFVAHDAQTPRASPSQTHKPPSISFDRMALISWQADESGRMLTTPELLQNAQADPTSMPGGAFNEDAAACIERVGSFEMTDNGLVLTGMVKSQKSAENQFIVYITAITVKTSGAAPLNEVISWWHLRSFSASSKPRLPETCPDQLTPRMARLPPTYYKQMPSLPEEAGHTETNDD